MHKPRLVLFALALVLAAGAFPPAAMADQWDKKTILTVNEPIQIPGQTLQPGKYTMKLMDSQSNRHIVQVFNEDGTQLITTILAIPNYRLQPTGKSEFGFWEMPVDQPKALRSWFYPGDNFGQEFAYPKQTATQIAQATHESVPAVSGPGATQGEVERVSPESKTTTAEAQPAPAPPAAAAPAEPERRAEPPAMAQSRPPEPPPARTEPAPAPSAPAQEPMPATASPLPLLALAGLLSLGAGSALRALAARRS
jgi:hypothetical protein